MSDIINLDYGQQLADRQEPANTRSYSRRRVFKTYKTLEYAANAIILYPRVFGQRTIFLRSDRNSTSHHRFDLGYFDSSETVDSNSSNQIAREIFDRFEHYRYSLF